MNQYIVSTTSNARRILTRRWPVSSIVAVLAGLMVAGATLAAPDLELSLVASNYNGYNISCFGMKDGGIDLSVTGGTAPYHYEWSNGATTQDISQLAAGYYKVQVVDANNEIAMAEITLEQPLPMKLDVDVYQYPNGYNVSCYGCYNGNAAVVVLGGAAPFTISWSDGPVAANRYNLGPKDYKIIVADANGCEGASATILLRGPERSDWSMTGNANTFPGQQYLGTPDNKDLVVKTNGTERLRLTADGKVQIAGLNTGGILKAGPDGSVSTVQDDDTPQPLDPLPYWSTHGNYTNTTNEFNEVLGTRDATPLKVITDNVEKMRLTSTGRLGLGTTLPLQKFEVHHTDIRGGMLLGNDLPGNAHSEIRFNEGANERWGLGCDLAALGDQDFFLWDNLAGSVRLYVDENGKVGIGTTYPETALHVQGDLLVRGGTGGDIVTSYTSGTGPVLWARNAQAAWGLSISTDGKGHILGDLTNPQPLMTFADASVGIGTTDPEASLHVAGDLLVRGEGWNGEIVTSSSDITGPIIWARNYEGAIGLSIDPDGKGHIMDDWNNPQPYMTFDDGKVGIGNVTLGESDLYKLYVEGGIIGRDLKVTALNFPDYVFAPSYSLMPLDTLENFIASENHLPGFPSANQIKEAGGFEVGDMSTRLLKLAEEQSLYILQLNKQVGELQARITILEAQAK
jgi:hypothetical protein